MTKQNIVMVMWDSVRADHLPFHGYERNTAPYLSKIARDGLVLDRTYVSGVGTPTSFTGIFTGEHAHGTQANIKPAHWRESNAGRRMLQEALQEEGYHTGAFHANALMSEYYGWNRGWDVFEDHLWTETENSGTARDDVSLRAMLRDGKGWWSALKKSKLHPFLKRAGAASEAIHAKNLVLGRQAYAPWESLWDNIEAFVRGAPEPFFLFVLLVDTHHPWCAPPRHRRWEQPGLRRMHALNYAMRRWPERTGFRRRSIVNAYDNELRHADDFLFKLDMLLDEESLDPALIVGSDHGDELGEHADYGHAPAMWDTVARVPLVMRNVGETGRREGPHSLLNLGSTVLDIAGSSERLSHRGSLLGAPDGPVHVENRTMDGRALRATVSADGRYKVVEGADGGLEAYDLEEDPLEQEPIAPIPALVEEHHRVRREDPGQGVDGPEGAAELAEAVDERLTELGYK
jgi:arylsulfatase